MSRRRAAPAPDVELWTSAPAFVTNERLEIVSWNDAARRLLGYETGEVIGRSCAEITGCPSRGEQPCLHGRCAHDASDRGEKALPVHERYVRRKDGKTVSSSIATVVVRTSQGPPLLLHVLRDITREAQLENALRDIAALAARSGATREGGAGEGSAAVPPELLTQRELDVLRLLRDGADTGEIAGALFVSPATVRNHIQSVFRKLHAHSRLEAVCLAVKNGLL